MHFHIFPYSLIVLASNMRRVVGVVQCVFMRDSTFQHRAVNCLQPDEEVNELIRKLAVRCSLKKVSSKSSQHRSQEFHLSNPPLFQQTSRRSGNDAEAGQPMTSATVYNQSQPRSKISGSLRDHRNLFWQLSRDGNLRQPLQDHPG